MGSSPGDAFCGFGEGDFIQGVGMKPRGVDDICSFIDFMYSSWSNSLSSVDRAMNSLCSDGVVREMSLVENQTAWPMLGQGKARWNSHRVTLLSKRAEQTSYWK